MSLFPGYDQDNQEEHRKLTVFQEAGACQQVCDTDIETRGHLFFDCKNILNLRKALLKNLNLHLWRFQVCEFICLSK